MTGRALRLLPAAADTLRRQPPQRKKAFREALRRLREDPPGVSVGLDVKVLETDEDLPKILRLRLGDWRISFVVDAKEVVVLHVLHRSEGYGWLDDLGY